jgi:GTP pyrophosphokinase
MTANTRAELLTKASARYAKAGIRRLEHAITFATEAHEGQTRASGEPYITHPLAVAIILTEWGMDVDSVIAGVLHDTIEDTDVTPEQIKTEFGPVVAFLVDGVTKLSGIRSHMRPIETYLPQTKDNLTKLLLALGQDIRVVIVKLADRLHNLRTLDALPPDKQRKIATESISIFAPIADRLNMGRVRVEIEDISFSYIDPPRYKFLTKLTEQAIKKSDRNINRIKTELSKLLDKEKIQYEVIEGRIKSIYSLHKKLNKHHQNIDEIFDLLALRVIVPDQVTCYLVLGLIHSIYHPMIGRIKDYISVPKQNGYQSLHTTVITPYEQIAEFQIRTADMHDYAEHGLAAAFHYNEQKFTDAYREGRIAELPTNLHWIRDLQKAASALRDGKKVNIDKLKIDIFKDRIFVYSPKGDIYDLPRGATALDYAYRVHTEVGKHAYAFKVSGRMAKFDEELQSGDIVEVITRKSALPTLDWLHKVITRHSRTKIKQQLPKSQKPTKKP